MVNISSVWIYVFILLYFVYKLKDCFSSFKEDLSSVFSKVSLKSIFVIVVLNIFLSYGLLYLSNFILNAFPAIGSLFNFQLSSTYLNNSLIAVGSFIATVFVSPICEELIFRGVLLNRFKIIMPTLFSVLVTSLLFASMHSYGSIIAAFIFAICMAILYLKTDNILVPIFAHFLNNLLAESIVIVDKTNMLFTNGIVIFAVSVLAVVSFALIIYMIVKELNKIK
ncbi:CPBP family intramembrane glutamic endopeptidase [Methanobrevibacter sp.]|uniref:CPBP family intramembrane glutamic endopeptidase n=1 Tax=Methanobrevibacter sp. TaxID=66852 RepID=UPI00386D4AD4